MILTHSDSDMLKGSDIGVTITGDLHKARQFDQSSLENIIRKASESVRI